MENRFEQIATELITEDVYQLALTGLGTAPTRADVIAFAAGVFEDQERRRLAAHAVDALVKLREVCLSEQAAALEELLGGVGMVFGVNIPPVPVQAEDPNGTDGN